MPEIARFYGIMLEGDLPNKAQNLIQEWGKMNQDDLMEIWNSQ